MPLLPLLLLLLSIVACRKTLDSNKDPNHSTLDYLGVWERLPELEATHPGAPREACTRSIDLEIHSSRTHPTLCCTLRGQRRLPFGADRSLVGASNGPCRLPALLRFRVPIKVVSVHRPVASKATICLALTFLWAWPGPQARGTCRFSCTTASLTAAATATSWTR